MTKKRLSDLLKEEAGKSDSPDLSNPESPPESRPPLSRRRGTAAALHGSSSQPTPIAPSPDQTPASVEATPPADIDSTVPDLEKVIARLETEKGTLANTVKALQADLEAQQGRLFELKDQLDKSQIELQEAKQTILKLSQANQAPATPTVARSAASKSSSRISGVDIIPRSPSQPGYRRGVPSQPAQVSQPNPMISNDDIGWVD
ncbi:MAG: hypothetical protein ACKO5P_03085 [Nodosilinea sp.]